MFTIECSSGQDIKNHSYYTREDEMLFLAAIYFKVRACHHLSHGLH